MSEYWSWKQRPTYSLVQSSPGDVSNTILHVNTRILQCANEPTSSTPSLIQLIELHYSKSDLKPIFAFIQWHAN